MSDRYTTAQQHRYNGSRGAIPYQGGRSQSIREEHEMVKKEKRSDIRPPVAVNSRGHNERRHQNEGLRPRPRDETPRRLPDACTNIRSFFEGPGYYRRNLDKWNATTLASMTAKHPKKSVYEVVQLLINDLRQLQYGLTPALRSTEFLYNKIVTSCRPQRLPTIAKGAFNNKKELECLRKELNSTPPKAVPKEPFRIPRKSLAENPQVVAKIGELDSQTTKGVLLASREKLAEDPNTIHEGVAPRKDAHKDGIPPNAIWTKLKRQQVNPTVLIAFGEECVEAEGFIVILRVLSWAEIEFFIQATIFHKGLFCLQY